jgi:hypothetical protein
MSTLSSIVCSYPIFISLLQQVTATRFIFDAVNSYNQMKLLFQLNTECIFDYPHIGLSLSIYQ